MVLSLLTGVRTEEARAPRWSHVVTWVEIGEDWTPRELRHSFVSILSDSGVSIETIADLVGHKTTVVTQKVYRHQPRPVITTGATTMNAIFNEQTATKSA